MLGTRLASRCMVNPVSDHRLQLLPNPQNLKRRSEQTPGARNRVVHGYQRGVAETSRENSRSRRPRCFPFLDAYSSGPKSSRRKRSPANSRQSDVWLTFWEDIVRGALEDCMRGYIRSPRGAFDADSSSQRLRWRPYENPAYPMQSEIPAIPSGFP